MLSRGIIWWQIGVFRRREKFHHLEVEKNRSRAIEELFLLTCSHFICTSYITAFSGWFFFNLCVCFSPCYAILLTFDRTLYFVKNPRLLLHCLWKLCLWTLLPRQSRGRALCPCPLTRETTACRGSGLEEAWPSKHQSPGTGRPAERGWDWLQVAGKYSHILMSKISSVKLL